MRSAIQNVKVLRFPDYGVLILLVWSIAIFGSLSWNLRVNHRDTLNKAGTEAETYWDLNLAYRKWNAQIGGVYAPINKVTPNPYLTVPQREITTTDNRTLTLINPAYMTRMVFDVVRSQSKLPIISRLTSLKYLNPDNSPDAWERDALSAFEQGTNKVTEVTTINSLPYLRFMKPFVADDSCLRCHGHQGYKTGDIRGGLSIAVPLSSYYADEKTTRNNLILIYSLLWISGAAGIVLFVLSQEKQKQQIVESEWKYRTVAEFSNDWGIWLSDRNTILFMTPSCRDITGYEQEEFIAAPSLLMTIIHPDDRDQWMKHLQSFDAPSHEDMELRIITKTGQIRWISHECGPINVQDRFHGRRINNRDITERKQAELALGLSEAHYRGLFENAPISIWEDDLSDIKKYMDSLKADGINDFRDYFKKNPQEIKNLITSINVIDVNSASLKLFKAARKEELLGPLGKIMTSQSVDAIMSGLCHLYEGNISFESEYLIKTLSGEYLTLYQRWMIASGFEDTWKKIIVSRIDLTALKHAESLVSLMLETVQEGFLIVDRDYRLLSANAAYLRLAGTTKAEALGKKCYELSPHKNPKPCAESGVDCPVLQTFKTGKSYVSSHEHCLSGNNTHAVAEIRTYPVFNAEGGLASVMATIVDITEKRKLEEELTKNQRLDSIGVLAGGIAHDFNNSLMGIMGYISLLKLKADPSLYEYINEAEKAVVQAKSLTQQLLTFAKGGNPVKKPLQIASLAEDAAKLALSGTNVKYEIAFDSDLKTVEADEGQIKQVIQNIVLNASEAMPRGGMVMLGIHNVSFPEDIATLKAGNYIEIRISDTGIGIPPRYLPTIFDPYFTTKKKGSGLGLATSFSIIKKHGGNIEVKSILNQGTTFTIFLPVTDKPVSSGSSKENIIYGKGKILILEDEDVVAAVAKEILGSLGYKADVATTGENTLHKYLEALETGEPYDCVILDLTIKGGMGGWDTMKGLLALNPGVKAIVSSGYAADTIMANYDGYGFKACLAKPYRLAELSQTLSKVLT